LKLNKLALRYAVFAILAITANLFIQRLIFLLGENTKVFLLAIGSGTLAGLVVKYILDKRWIFHDMSSSALVHTKKFILYAITGIITTTIFWSTEAIFWFNWKSDLIRDLGAIIGLSIGYILKYHLDKRYVFID
jgi:putative flippase GtrA